MCADVLMSPRLLRFSRSPAVLWLHHQKAVYQFQTHVQMFDDTPAGGNGSGDGLSSRHSITPSDVNLVKRVPKLPSPMEEMRRLKQGMLYQRWCPAPVQQNAWSVNKYSD